LEDGESQRKNLLHARKKHLQIEKIFSSSLQEKVAKLFLKTDTKVASLLKKDSFSLRYLNKNFSFREAQ
jgi:hypothetical protein